MYIVGIQCLNKKSEVLHFYLAPATSYFLGELGANDTESARIGADYLNTIMTFLVFSKHHLGNTLGSYFNSMLSKSKCSAKIWQSGLHFKSYFL